MVKLLAGDLVQTLKFEYQGQSYEGQAEIVGQKLWLHLNGESFCVALEDAIARKKSKDHGLKSGVILAPMPGKVTKVLADNGAVVKKGDSVIVLEAMKMEYTLKAAVNGTIQKILHNVGDQVALGDLLVEIKEES